MSGREANVSAINCFYYLSVRLVSVLTFETPFILEIVWLLTFGLRSEEHLCMLSLYPEVIVDFNLVFDL
jgi:hypothetical protein